MSENTIDLRVNNTQAISGLRAVETQVTRLRNSFTGLRNAIAGLALGTVIANTLRFADGIQDVSDATNIAVANILQFNAAVQESGGNSEQANEALLNLTRNIGLAREGSNSAQAAFAKLGINLNQLRTLSEKDILERTLTALAEIGNASDRAAASAAILGNRIKGVDVGALAQRYGNATTGISEFARATRAASELQGKMDAAFMALQRSILIALRPLIEFINKLDDKAIAGFINAVVQLGAAAAIFVAFATAIRGVLVGVQAMISGIGALGTTIGGFLVVIIALVGILKTFYITISVLVKYAFPAWMAAIKAGTGLAGEMITTVITLGKRFKFLILDLKLMVAGFIRLLWPIGKIIAIIYLLIDAIKKLSEGKTLGDVIDSWAESLERFVTEKFPKLAKAINWLGEKLGMGQPPSVGVGGGRSAGIGGPTAQELADFQKTLTKPTESDAARKLREEVANIVKEYTKTNSEIVRALKFETDLVGKSADQVEFLQAEADIRRRINDQIEQLLQKRKEWADGTEEQKSNLYLIDAAIAKIKSTQESTVKAVTSQVLALQSARTIEADRLRLLEQMENSYNEQTQRAATLQDILRGVREDTAGVLFEREQLGRGPVQQQIAAAYDSARRSALEAQRQFAETFGDADGLTPERMAELVAGLDAIAAAFNNLAFQTENNILISQQWSTGWKDAYATFVDNALNAADRAREVFNGMVSSMENALDNFVRTGKLNFRDLINSMIADLMSAALRQAFRNLLMATSGSGGGGWLSSLGRFFAGFFANGGFIPPGKAGIVGERGPELVQGPAQVTPLTGMSAPINNYYTYNINALDAKSVAQLFSENRRTLLGVTEQARKEMPIRQRF